MKAQYVLVSIGLLLVSTNRMADAEAPIRPIGLTGCDAYAQRRAAHGAEITTELRECQSLSSEVKACINLDPRVPERMLECREKFENDFSGFSATDRAVLRRMRDRVRRERRAAARIRERRPKPRPKTVSDFLSDPNVPESLKEKLRRDRQAFLEHRVSPVRVDPSTALPTVSYGRPNQTDPALRLAEKVERRAVRRSKAGATKKD